MRNILGNLIIAVGIAVGAYLGIWVMFIGGIIQIVDTIKTDFQGLQVAIGVIKILLAGFVGWGSFAIIGALGGSIIK